MPGDSKHILFTDSMFHICIENSQYPNYFTEKIADCFTTLTLPIYWGATNIANYFDSRGIITFNNIEQLHKIISTLTPADYYSRVQYMLHNQKIASTKYGNFVKRINNILNTELMRV